MVIYCVSIVFVRTKIKPASRQKRKRPAFLIENVPLTSIVPQFLLLELVHGFVRATTVVFTVDQIQGMPMLPHLKQHTTTTRHSRLHHVITRTVRVL